MFEVELKKQLKIAARKQHYFALAESMNFVIEQIKDTQSAICAMAGKRLEEISGPEDLDGIPKGALIGASAKASECLVILYQITQSLLTYQQAFGEFPEWILFTPIGKDGDKAVEEFCKRVQESFFGLNKILGSGKDKESLLEIAFGDRFLKKSEAIKLKGE